MLVANPVQTSYQRWANVGQVGMPATTVGFDVDTRICEDLSSPKVGIAFGVVVSQGTKHGARSATLGLASGGAAVGITAADITLPNVQTSFTDRYQDGENMAVMRVGDLWVTVKTSTVVAGNPVYFNSSTGELGDSGISNATLLTGAKWMTDVPSDDPLLTTQVGSLAIVRLHNA